MPFGSVGEYDSCVDNSMIWKGIETHYSGKSIQQGERESQLSETSFPLSWPHFVSEACFRKGWGCWRLI